MVVPTEDMCWRTVRDGMGGNFGRTHLRISASKAKFDARADGAVRLAVRRPKPRKIREIFFRSENFVKNDFFAPYFVFCKFCGRRKFIFEIFPPHEI